MEFNQPIFYENATGDAVSNNADPPLIWLCIDGSAVEDVDFSAAETLRSPYGVLKEHGVRLVFAQVMDDVKTESRYDLRSLVGDDASFGTLAAVLQPGQRAMPPRGRFLPGLVLRCALRLLCPSRSLTPRTLHRWRWPHR